MRQRRPPVKDRDHLALVRQLPCIICGDDTTVEAAHIRYSDSRAGKLNTGMQQKSDDKFALPLCGKHHRQQHDHGDERSWWAEQGIDPIFYALAIYASDGEHEKASEIVFNRLALRAR
jgi:hypothetical protein